MAAKEETSASMAEWLSHSTEKVKPQLPRPRPEALVKPNVSDIRRPSFTQFLRGELTSDFVSQDDDLNEKKLDLVYNFLLVPFQLERVLFFGFWVCCDSFLFVFSFLPIRVVIAFLQLMWSLPKKGFKAKLYKTQIFDVYQSIIIICTSAILLQFDTSVAYHWIRQQQTIKLYIVFNALEIFDRLCCSFGQDIFDALFGNINAKGPRKRDRIMPAIHVMASLIYVLIHSLVLFYQCVAMNVAINSKNNALLTLLISNNFVELKGSVFKRFRRDNVFQLTCSDIVERFQIFVFMMVIVMHNFYDLAWNLPTEVLWVTVYSLALVGFTEILIDWIKHAFVTKFNRITADCYPRYLGILRADVIQACPSIQLDDLRSRGISQSRRIGFVPLPLACLVLRFVYPMCSWSLYGWVVVLLVVACIATLKVLIRIVLLGECLQQANTMKEEDKEAAGSLWETTRFNFTKQGNRIP